MQERFKTLKHFMTACLHPISSKFNIGCTVLLNGLRGTGKKTLVESVAQELGLHLFEVLLFAFFRHFLEFPSPDVFIDVNLEKRL
jgi:SpoVK/Ycf46/Vps4 family AAA+-type ATPase